MKQGAMGGAGSGERRALRVFLGCMSLLATLLVAGCGQTSQAAALMHAAPVAVKSGAAPAVAPERLEAGRQLFARMTCVGCHTIADFPEARGTLGPDLTHIATQAPEILLLPSYQAASGQATTAREYFVESILSPATYVAEDCPNGACPTHLMPEDFAQRLSSEDLALLLDFLSARP